MITPAAFRSLGTEQIQALEERIDSSLVAARTRGRQFAHVGVAGFHAAVIQEVIAHYKAVGWHAELVLDSRDGDYVNVELQS